MCDEEDKDYLMYVSEITAYWAASVAAIIYIWETIYKSLSMRNRNNKKIDPELGLTEEERQESVFSSENSSPSHSPLSLSGSLRSRIYSSMSK